MLITQYFHSTSPEQKLAIHAAKSFQLLWVFFAQTHDQGSAFSPNTYNFSPNLGCLDKTLIKQYSLLDFNTTSVYWSLFRGDQGRLSQQLNTANTWNLWRLLSCNTTWVTKISVEHKRSLGHLKNKAGDHVRPTHQNDPQLLFFIQIIQIGFLSPDFKICTFWIPPSSTMNHSHSQMPRLIWIHSFWF